MNSVPAQPEHEDVFFENMQDLGQGLHAWVRWLSAELVVKLAKDSVCSHHLREKMIHERLGEHPYILRCHGEVTVNSLSGPMRGLLLPYMSGGRLQDLLTDSNRPPQSIERRKKWCMQITEAVAYIHSKHIVHGDLGAHNILIDHSDNLKLADFGGSRIDGSQCLAGPAHRYKRLGKDVCIQNHNYAPTGKDDTFALGTVLYELAMYGQIFSMKSRPEIVDLILGRHLPALDAIESPTVRVTIAKCWREEYEDAGDVLADLQCLKS